MRRYELKDDQWDQIKDFLPGREWQVGGTAKDKRLFVEAVLYRHRKGIKWRDLPVCYGKWKIIHQRFSRWSRSGVFARILNILSNDQGNELMSLDSSTEQSIQHSAAPREKTAETKPMDAREAS